MDLSVRRAGITGHAVPTAPLDRPRSRRADLDPLGWALRSNAIALAALLFVVGWIVLRASGGSWGATTVATALAVLGVPTLFAYAHV